MDERDKNEPITGRTTIARDPFGVFAIVMASGDRYVVDDPASVSLGGDTVSIAPPRGNVTYTLRFHQINAIEANEPE